MAQIATDQFQSKMRIEASEPFQARAAMVREGDAWVTTGAQKTDPESGLPVWRAPVEMKIYGQRRSSVNLNLDIAAEQCPQITTEVPLIVDDLGITYFDRQLSGLVGTGVRDAADDEVKRLRGQDGSQSAPKLDGGK